MAKIKVTAWFFVMILSVVAIMTVAVFGISTHNLKRNIALARLSIDTQALVAVNNWLDNGAVSDLLEYQRLVDQLNKITAHFGPVAKWSYIAAQASDPGVALLSVLTVDHAPGILYSTKAYPALGAAVYGNADIVVSGIVWDDRYKILTRTVFAKLHHDGDMVGVLCVDVETSNLVLQLLSVIFLSLAFVCVILLFAIKMASTFGLIMTQDQYARLKECK